MVTCSLGVFALFFVPLTSSPHFEVAECQVKNDVAWTGNPGYNGVREVSDIPGGFTPGTVATKLFSFVSKVAGDVGADVKKTVLQGMSRLRTSEQYKKAKYLIAAPAVDTAATDGKLQKWGKLTIEFLHMYNHIPPDARVDLLKVAFEEVPSLAKLSRKYLHVGEQFDPENCYKSLHAIEVIAESMVQQIQMKPRVQQRKSYSHKAPVRASAGSLAGSTFGMNDPGEGPRAGDLMVDPSQDVDVNRVAHLVELFIKQLPRIMFYYVYPFSNCATLSGELALYVGKMVPRGKRLFSLTWLLASILPPSTALAKRRMMVDYLNDAIGFEEGLKALCMMEGGKPYTYNPFIDYYYRPPPPVILLEAPRLLDSL